MNSSRIVATLLLAGALSIGAAPAFAASDPTSFVNENDTPSSSVQDAGGIGGADEVGGIGGADLASTGADGDALTNLLMVGGGALTLGLLAVGATSPTARRARRRAMSRFRR